MNPKRISLPVFAVAIAIFLLLSGGVVVYRNLVGSSISENGRTAIANGSKSETDEGGAVTFQGKARSELTIKDCEEMGLSGTATKGEIENWIKVNKGSAESWMAAVLLGKGDEDSVWLEKAVEAHPNEPAIAIMAAMAELQESDKVDWTGWSDHFRKLDPDNAVGFLLSARKSANSEDWADALNNLEAATVSEQFRQYQVEHENALVRYFESQGYREAASVYLLSLIHI